MTSRWQVVLMKCRYEPRIIPLLLGLLRIAICLWPQTGYLHPDEFFQSSDIVSGRYFSKKVQLAWEFTTDKPIRCMLMTNILNSIAFKSLYLITKEPSSYLLLVAPRLIYTLASFSIDFCLYKLCQYYSSRGLWYLPVSVIFQSSFICLGVFTRTLSNTIEAIIFAWLLVVICRIVKPTFRVLFVTPTRSTPIRQASIKRSAQVISSILIGILVTLGAFNRITFISFAMVPCIYWLIESLKRNSYKIGLTLQRAILPLIISSFFTFAIISCYDTIYYRDYETVRDIFYDLLDLDFDSFYTKLKSNWIVTPYNFLLYNTKVENVLKYGLHMPYTHALVNLPFAFNVLAIVFYRKLLNLLIGSGVYRLIFCTHRIYATMLLTILTPVILLSFIPHQEFRFLAPIVIPLAYAHSFNIYTSNRLLGLWLIINFTLAYFYTRVHQSGVTNAILDLDLILKEHKQSNVTDITDIIAIKCYPVPSYVLNIDSDDDRFNVNLSNSMMEDFEEGLSSKLNPIIDRMEQRQNYNPITHTIYIILHSLYEHRLSNYLAKIPSFNGSTTRIISNNSPHFSGEELQESIEYLRQHGMGTWRKAFGLSLVRISGLQT